MNDNKTCGDCRFYNSDFNLCLHWRHEDINEHSQICNYFKPITNGDRIRQMSNEELAGVIECPYLEGMCLHRDDEYPCKCCKRDWLNTSADAPDTEKGVKDEC